MMTTDKITANAFSRRGFLGLAGAVASVPLIAACGGGSASQSGSAGGAVGTIKFWDMPWGQASYTDAAQKLVKSYAPSGKLPKASYQQIQWNNFYQTFSSAIASKTGPAVSTGAGFQAFQFSEQGQIAYADNVIETLKKNGQYDDFLPGTIESMKTEKGYVAVPWQLDMQVLWYRKSLLEKAEVTVPTDWASFKDAGTALKKIGVFGLAMGAGAGNNMGNHAIVSLMLNNGGGLFSEDGKPDVTNDRNVEAMEYLRELVSLGIIDRAAVSYSGDNVNKQWKDRKVGFGIDNAALASAVGDTGADVQVASPLAGPHGDKGSLTFANNIMMYKNTPSQAGSEAFLVWYLSQIKTFWQQSVVGAMPVLKSIVDSKEFQADPRQVKIIKEWQPVGKTFGTKSAHLFGNLAAVDGGQAINKFTQTMLGGKTDAKTALANLQKGIESVVK